MVGDAQFWSKACEVQVIPSAFLSSTKESLYFALGLFERISHHLLRESKMHLAVVGLGIRKLLGWNPDFIVGKLILPPFVVNDFKQMTVRRRLNGRAKIICLKISSAYVR